MLAIREGKRISRSEESLDDEGVSGATLERPALQRLLSAVRAGPVGAVIVHRLDRLSRRVRVCSALLEEFKAHNVRPYIAAMPELSNGATDTLMLNILSAFAEFERDMIGSRIRDTRVGLVERGRRIAGVTPFGYTSEKRTKQLAPVEPEAEVVRGIFRLLAEGRLPREVARMAAERGWKTRAGRPWTARQILDTVANPVYIGCFRSAEGMRPGTHEPIVDQELFDRRAAAIAARRTSPAGSRVRREWSPLVGKVRCARCGKAMGIRVTANGPRRYVYCRCRTADAGSVPCTGTQVRAFDLEGTVRPVLKEPARAFPRRRGRPTPAAVTLYSLGQILPLLDPKSEREFLRQAIHGVIWNADTRGIRLTLKLKALTEGLPLPIGLVTSVCRLAPACRW